MLENTVKSKFYIFVGGKCKIWEILFPWEFSKENIKSVQNCTKQRNVKLVFLLFLPTEMMSYPWTLESSSTLSEPQTWLVSVSGKFQCNILYCNIYKQGQLSSMQN
jgi:hypothetical protein